MMLSSALFDDIHVSLQWLSVQFIQLFNVALFLAGVWFVDFSIALFAYAYLACFIITGLGIFGGYHRLASHGNPHAIKTKFFVFVGMLAGSGPPVGWIVTHHAHHKHSDTMNDPHVWEREGVSRWAPWLGVWLKPGCPSIEKLSAVKLYRDAFYRFASKHYYTIVGVYVVALAGFGGWTWVFAAYAAPAVFSIVAQTAIVSLSHKNNQPVNRLILWPLMWGECFHQDHHENKRTYRQLFFDPLYFLAR